MNAVLTKQEPMLRPSLNKDEPTEKRKQYVLTLIKGQYDSENR